MAERVVNGDTVTFKNTFVVDGTDTDPTNVTLDVVEPGGSTVSYTNGGLTNSAVGVWQVDYMVSTNGVWTSTWEGDSPAADVSTSTLTVWPLTADDNDVLTLLEAKNALGLDQTVTTNDDDLAQLITAVSGQLDRWVGPVAERTVTDERHDGGSTLISLNERPVSSVTSATEYDGAATTALTEQTDGTTPANGFTVTTGGIVHRLSGGDTDRFPAGRKNVKVTYVAGRYSNADGEVIGAKYKQAAIMMLRNVWTSELASGSQTFGAMTDGFTNPLLGPGMLNKVVALLGREQDRPLVG